MTMHPNQEFSVTSKRFVIIMFGIVCLSVVVNWIEGTASCPLHWEGKFVASFMHAVWRIVVALNSLGLAILFY